MLWLMHPYDPRYVAFATYGLEKIATSAWRDLVRNGTREMREAISARMPNAVKGLATQDYITTRAPVRAAMAAPAADRWEHSIRVREARQPYTLQAIRGDVHGGAYKPSQGVLRDTLDRGHRLSELPTLASMYQHHQQRPLPGQPSDPHELSQWVANRYADRRPGPNLP